MFKHVGLTAQETTDLGSEQAQQARSQNQHPTPEMIARDQQQKEARANLCSAFSRPVLPDSFRPTKAVTRSSGIQSLSSMLRKFCTR